MYKSMENDFHSNFALAAPYIESKNPILHTINYTSLLLQTSKPQLSLNPNSEMTNRLLLQFKQLPLVT